MGLDTTNNNVNYGTPLNPHNQGYYTGGSSGGSACVAAQGICPITLGMDGGGSIRLPASFCGMYGLKTTHGRVSSRAGEDKTWNSVGVAGPIASNIDDLALSYRIMAEPDSLSRHSSSFPRALVKSPVGVRSQGSKKYLGVFKDWVERSDPEVLQMFNATVDHLVKNEGYEVVQITIPFIPEGQKAHALTILAESRAGLTLAQISKLTYHNQLLLNVTGSQGTAQDFLFSQKLRTLHMAHLQWLWEKYPGMLIVTPTTPCAGWKIKKPSDITGHGIADPDMSLRSMEYVYLANWTGCPAISCPMGYTEDNVPVGFMVCRALLSHCSMLTLSRLWQIGAWRSSCSLLRRRLRACWVTRAFDGHDPMGNGLMCSLMPKSNSSRSIELSKGAI
jgi:Asp-tRNA(Asn)/Glu-tRNA(Gln) amidotransferase A subunit family amidase